LQPVQIVKVESNQLLEFVQEGVFDLEEELLEVGYQ
jgi:hypothetical protein